MQLAFHGAAREVTGSCHLVTWLAALRRVLKPIGQLHMLEHTGSRHFPFNVMLNVTNPLVRRFGPEVNSDTLANVTRAGFDVRAVVHVYLDDVKMIHAVALGVAR